LAGLAVHFVNDIQASFRSFAVPSHLSKLAFHVIPAGLLFLAQA
jgi:hypothetical protein